MRKILGVVVLMAVALLAGSAYAACTKDADCPAGQVCVAGECKAPCVPNCTGKTCDADDGCGTLCGCEAGLTCVGTECKKACAADADCAAGQKCVEGFCAACVADCTGKTCDADNGCGTLCGCEAGLTCVGTECKKACEADADCAAGQKCVEGFCAAGCTPACTDKQCGDDGCGGTCGTCDAGKVCNAGKCEDAVNPWPTECKGLNEPSGDDCLGTTYEGCCSADGRLYFCDAGKLFCLDCTQNPSCSWSADAGFYDCGGDGSAEPTGQFPYDCVVCDPACEAGFKCVGGECVVCEPNCTGKACGDDGCGGSCGTCEGDLQCIGGQCVAGDSCAGACGGQAASGCYCDEECVNYGDCCPDVCEQCPELAACAAPCEPACEAGFVCVDGECVDQGDACLGPGTPVGNDCGAISDIGCCSEAGKLYYCQQGALYCIDCGANAPECGWSAENSWYDCGTDGAEDPSGLNPLTCDAGACVPDCSGKVCGSDGCDGECGTCDEGLVCDAGQCISTVPAEDLGGNDKDVATEEDVPVVPGNDVVTGDTTGEDVSSGGGGGSSCSTSATGAGMLALLMLLLALVAVPVVIKK